MSETACVFLPDVPFTNDSQTKQEIAKALNEKYPKAAIETLKIILSKKENKYYAYVQTTAEHEKNLLNLKDISVGGRTVHLKICFPNHQIYINKLPDNINKQEIQKYFEKFGKIQRIQLLSAESNYENARQKSNINHCYIRYENNESAEQCLFTENKHCIKNKEDIRVVRAYKIGQNDETDKRLFLKISPVVQFNINKFEKELYVYFSKFGELREKIRIEQLNNLSSKAYVTFTSYEAGDKALQNFSLQKFQQYSLILRPNNSKESYTAFIGNLLQQNTTEEKLRIVLEKYGKIVNCTLNPSRKTGQINAIVTFSEEQSLKSALAQYNTDKDLLALFASKPYMDMHMSASLRNQYKSFQRKDKKPVENPVMNMGGIGIGYNIPSRMTPPPTFMGYSPPVEGFNQMNQFNPNMGMINAPIGMMNSTMGMGNMAMNPNFGMGLNTNNRVPPQNFRPQ